LTGDEIGFIAGEECHRACYIQRLPHASQRSEFGPRARVIACLVFCAFDLNRARRHTVHGDPVFPELHGRHLGEHLDAAFTRRVADQIRERDLIAARPYIDDAPAALFLHVASGALCAEKTALQVGIDHAVPLVLLQFQEGFPDLRARVVDEDVESRETRQHCGEHSVHSRGIAYVRLHCKRGPAQRRNFRYRAVGPSAIAMIVHGHVASVPRQFQRDFLADPFTCSCNECGFHFYRILVAQVMQFTVTPADAGKRLDLVLHERFPAFSRSRVQDWIRAGRVLVNGGKVRSAYLVHAADSIDAEPADPPPLHAEPEDIPLAILYEDDDLVAIDKPAGMVVHAGAGVHSGTLVNALLHRFQALSGVGGALRPGIVHRLDRFTSGVLLVAKNDVAHQRLAAQFSGRQVEKVYLAMVHGEVRQDHGRIERPIARDPAHRTRMTARLDEGRAAWSEYRVLRRLPRFTLLEVRIGTGRTHQIRVHLSSIGHPVVGDTLYGAPARIEGREPLGRYFLHAHRIRFQQPTSGWELVVVSPLPPELQNWAAGT
jgi:23S rRNA pseudouridine1911/1915/1917 synthase